MTDYYDQFYDSLIQLRGIENMQGTGYNDYLRWKWFYSTRHGVDGEFGAMWETITEYYNNFQFPQNYTDESDWQFIGPLGIPLGHGHSSSENTGKGMMISIWVDDDDHSLIYAGSHHGGLWKTTDGGENWYPLHDNDERIHGVNSIAVNPDDNNIIYITCNSSLSSSTVGNFSEYTAGLFRSINGGSSWNKLDPGINYPASNKSASARKIIVDPNGPDILFFLSYRLITRSNDQGANWDTVFFKNYDPWNNQGYIQNHSGLWDLEIAPWDTSIAYLAGSEIFIIDNPAGTFDTTNISDNVFLIGLNPGESLIMHPHRCEVTMNENFPDKAWFTYAADYNINGASQSKLRIVKYDIVKDTYNLLLDTNNALFYLGLGGAKLEAEISPSDSNVVYIGGVEISKVDANKTPPEITGIFDASSEYPDSCWIHIDMRDMQIFSDGHGNDTIYLANDGGVSWGTTFKGENGPCADDSWHWRHPCSSLLNGLNVAEYYGIGLCESAPDLVAGGCQDLSNMLYNNGDWINFGDGDGSEIVWDKVDVSRFYFSEWQNGRLYRTNDFGATNTEFFDLANGNPFMPMEIDPDASDVLYSGDTKLYKFIGIDNSGSLDDTVLLHEFPHFISDIEVVHPSGMQKTYYISTYHTDNSDPISNCIYKSTNGTTYTDISAGLEGCKHGFISDIEVNPENVSQIWVAISVYNNNSTQKKKLYFSSNSGLTWQDYSQGLFPGMPVFEIRYIPTYDYLFAATDVGIFKRTMQDTAWYPFSQNLPAGKIITDLEVNHEYNTIMASTYGRGLWKTPIRCEYNETPWTIRENLEWNKDTILDCSIVIEENITVTLDHCKIFMPADAKIVVKRGAALILEGCTLTSACNDLWWGIEVWGNSNYSQSSSVQGRLEVNDNSLIEKARKAIFCGKNIENTYPDWAYTGGIVDASGSTFKNNRYGVQLWTYRNPQIMANFESCKFQTNQILADGSSPEYFMTLVQVNGVKIKSCSFDYEIDGVPDFRDHGRGIYAIDAGFEVMPDTNFKPCIFKNLDCGIFALKLYENKPLEVHESYFGDNLTGIYVSAIEGVQIYLNEFDLNFDSIPASSQIFGGIYLDNCTGYKVEENVFGETNLFSRFSPSIGITINNSGDAYNEIYKNTFGKLYIGALAQNINRSKLVIDGLKLNCNVFHENEYDMSVTGPTGCDECGISIRQGSSSVPAGNLFSHRGDHSTSDLDNHMREITYYHHKFIIGHDTMNYPWVPRYYSDSVALINVLNVPFDSLTTCPSHLARSLELASLRQFYFESKQATDSLSNELIILTDGGSTSEVEMDIIFAQPDDAIELMDELLGYSPYLSDTILIRSAEKEDVLVPVMIKEIMVANPQSAKSDKVLHALENRENELPDYMMDEILAGKDSIAHKEMLESDLSFWNLQKQVAMNQLINYYNKELVVSGHDSIISLLEEADNLQAKYRLILAFLEKEDTISSNNMLESIPDQYDLTASQIVIHQHWAEFTEFINQIIQDSLTINELDSLQIESLIELSSFEDQPGSLARNYLDYLGFTEIRPYYLLPENQLKSDREEIPLLKNLYVIKDPFVKIYPNPAKNYLIVEYDLGKEFSNATLRIFSNEGKLMFQKSLDYQKHDMIINTRNWNQGVYFFSFISPNHQKQNGKFIISR